MKKELIKANSLIAKAALAVVKASTNSTCPYVSYQPPMPKTANKLRKF